MPSILFDIIDEGTEVDVIVTNPVVDAGISDEVVSVVTVEGPVGPPGPPGDGTQVFGEALTGMNGVTTVFTTVSEYAADSTAVYLNGLRETHYTESGAAEITFSDPPLAGDSITADYLIA